MMEQNLTMKHDGTKFDENCWSIVMMEQKFRML